MAASPASGSGCRLLGFLAGLGVGLLLVHDPGVGLVEELGHCQQVVEAQAVGFFPGGVALLVAAGGNDAVPVALFAGVRQIVTCRTPMRILCAGLDMMISFSSFRPRQPGPYGTSKEPASAGSFSDGQAEKLKASACGKRSFLIDRPGGGFISAVNEGHGRGWLGEKGEQPEADTRGDNSSWRKRSVE